MKKLNYEKTFYSISIVMIIIWAFALVSLLFGFDTPQYSRSKTISENEEYLYQWTNKLKNGTAFNNLCFSDGTCMTSAGVGSISVYTNPNYLTGSGILSSPLSVNSDNVTIQGNTFNSANKLLQLDGTGLIPSYLIPTLNYLLKTGDTMSGHLNMGGNNVLNVSTISINGNGYTNYIYGNASQNDNITYILPYSTDIAEGSYLTYGSNGQLSWQQPDNLGNHIATTSLNMSGYDINNANYINAVKYYGDGSELTNISGDNLGNHIATMTLTTNYGINTSTIQTKNILVYDAQPYINILSLNYLNSPEIRFSTIATNSSWSIGNVNTWNDTLVFKQKGLNEKMILTQAGNVSIGNNISPSEKLEVQGNVKADKFINTTAGTINDIIVATAVYALNGDGSSNVIVASTNSWSGINTFNNNTIYNSSISINANTSQQYSLTIDSNSNSTDGFIFAISTSGIILDNFVYKSYPPSSGYLADSCSLQQMRGITPITFTVKKQTRVAICANINVKADQNGYTDSIYLYLDGTSRLQITRSGNGNTFVSNYFGCAVEKVNAGSHTFTLYNQCDGGGFRYSGGNIFYVYNLN